MQLVFLGTGGSVPSKNRNVPAVALKIGREIVLFDCGEGTQRQFMHSPLSFMQVSKIFISHMHGDHFLGINGLVQTMSFSGRTEVLEIYGPSGTSENIRRFLALGHFTPSFEIKLSDMTDGDKRFFETYTVESRLSAHIVPNLAYSVTEPLRPGKFNRAEAERLGIPAGPLFSRLQNGETIRFNGKTIMPEMIVGPPRRGRKIVYTGDTAPDVAICELARDCDVLIHDCTTDEMLEKKTNIYGHSSARQAAETAKKANARVLILTHISPRYEDAASLLEEARRIFPNTILAEDMMVYEVPFPPDDE